MYIIIILYSVLFVYHLPQGIMAVHSPYTGIIDYGQVTKSFAEEFKERGGCVYTGFEVR